MGMPTFPVKVRGEVVAGVSSFVPPSYGFVEAVTTRLEEVVGAAAEGDLIAVYVTVSRPTAPPPTRSDEI